MSQIDWKEVARRHKTQSVLITDASAEAFKRGTYAKLAGTPVNMRHYRHFDGARALDRNEIKKVIAYLREQEYKHPGYLLKLSRRIISHYAKVKKWVERNALPDYRRLSNEELANKFWDYYMHLLHLSVAYTYIVVNMFLPDEIVASVAERERDIHKQTEYLATLFASDKVTEIKAEKMSLYKIAAARGISADKQIYNHWRKFKHLKRYYYFKSDATLADIKKQVAAARQKIKKGDTVVHPKTVAKETKQIIAKLKLSPEVVKKIYALKSFGMSSNIFDENLAYQISKTEPMLKDIYRRLGLTRNEAIMARGAELVAALKGRAPANFKKQLRDRWKDYAIVSEHGAIKLYIGKALQTYRKKELKREHIDKSLKSLKGQAASPGTARGKVVLLFDAALLNSVKKGNILVAPSTYPALVPAMERAAAIVTEEGGLLSHAAIVSRELGIPCVVGTKIATKVFKNGDRVEVDANAGVVKRI